MTTTVREALEAAIDEAIDEHDLIEVDPRGHEEKFGSISAEAGRRYREKEAAAGGFKGTVPSDEDDFASWVRVVTDKRLRERTV